VGTRVSDANLSYADLSHADVSRSILTGATLFRARLHRPKDEDTEWGDRTTARGEDEALALAERWQPAERAPEQSSEGVPT
jgi:uncharacterized protein YjbI with pentapeptide repeats